jgi:hypothetical protein
MHPEIERQMAKAMVEELRRSGRPSRRNTMSASRANGSLDGEVVIRASRPNDVPALHALAALDGVVAPLGTVLVAEVNGSIVAALPLDGHRSFADPFRHTDDLVALLEARARQLKHDREEPAHRSRLAWLAPSALRRLV